MADIRNILFDFDGTLVDTAPGIIRTAKRAMADFGMAPEQIGDPSPIVGPPFPYAFELVYGMSHDDAVWVTKRYRELYEGITPNDYPPFAGVPEMLRALRDKGVRLGIATSRLEPLTLRMAAGAGLDGYFDVICGQHPGEPNDKAHIVGRALAELGGTPEDTVMVGDRRFDVEGAAANGLSCIGVYSGTAPAGELEQTGAADVAHGHAELSAKLLGLVGASGTDVDA